MRCEQSAAGQRRIQLHVRTHRSGGTSDRSTVFCLLVWLQKGWRRQGAGAVSATRPADADDVAMRAAGRRALARANLTQMTWHVSASVNCSVLFVRMLHT